MEVTLDGRALPASPGDTVALAIVRAGEHPGTAAPCASPGTAATAWPRSTAWPGSAPARCRHADGTVVQRHPAAGAPAALTHGDPSAARSGPEHADVVVVGAGASGRAAAWAGRGRRYSCSTPPTARRSSPSTPGRRWSCGVPTAGAVELVHLHAHEVVLRHWCRLSCTGVPGQRAYGELFTDGPLQPVLTADRTAGAVAVRRPPWRPLPFAIPAICAGEEGGAAVLVVWIDDGGGLPRTPAARVSGLGPHPAVLARMAGRGDGESVQPGGGRHAIFAPTPPPGWCCPCAGPAVGGPRGRVEPGAPSWDWSSGPASAEPAPARGGRVSSPPLMRSGGRRCPDPPSRSRPAGAPASSPSAEPQVATTSIAIQRLRCDRARPAGRHARSSAGGGGPGRTAISAPRLRPFGWSQCAAVVHAQKDGGLRSDVVEALERLYPCQSTTSSRAAPLRPRAHERGHHR